jgi:YD repeat-containing protein
MRGNNNLFLTSLICIMPFMHSSCVCCRNPQDTACIDKVKTVTSGGITATYTYDGSGRVALISRSDGSSTAYTYGSAIPATVTEVDTPASGTPTSITYTLDSHGLAVSDSRGTTYEYDSNGFVIKTVYPTFTDLRTIVDGDIVVETRTGTNAITFNETFSALLNCQDFGLYFRGKQNRNLPTGQTASDGSPPINYIYEYSNGKVVTRTATGGASSVATYTYY